MPFDDISTLNLSLNKSLSLIFIIMIIIEALVIAYYKRSKYNFADTAGSFGVAIGNIFFKPLTKGFLLLVFNYTEKFALWHLPLDNVGIWIIGFFAMEFTYYWQHRFMHEIRYMWLSHMVHHSSNTFTLPSAIRLSWVSLASFSWVVYLPLVIIGFPPIMIAILMSLNLSYQFLLHTEIFGKWRILGMVFNTPEHHKIHHASNPEYLDKNYGGILIIYDRMFGTFAQFNPQIMPIFGLTKPILSNNPFKIVLSGWWDFFKDCKNSKSFKQLAINIIGRP